MRHDSLLAYFAVMALSLLCVLFSMTAISIKDKSWINWQTFAGVQNIGVHYVLPFFYMLAVGTEGSISAYVFCYTTLGLSSVALALTYCFIKPLRLRKRVNSDSSNVDLLPWALLILGCLIYLPVLIAFRQYLTEPRQIYAEFSRAGFGLNFFVSSALTLLAFITYLFKKRKSLIGGIIFMALCVAVVYLHGSKGQLLSIIFIGFLYRTYVHGRRLSFLQASTVILSLCLLTATIFAVFGSVADRLDLLTTMSGYADYDRNAIKVMDDARTQRYYGMLELEDEFYSRMPRILIPDKPRDYGQVRLATTYYPNVVRESAGTPSFGIGLQYADFGPYSLLWIVGGSIFTGWCARTIVCSLRDDSSLGKFLLLLFFSGITLIPLGSGYLLPETFLMSLALSFIHRNSFRPLRHRRL